MVDFIISQIFRIYVRRLAVKLNLESGRFWCYGKLNKFAPPRMVAR